MDKILFIDDDRYFASEYLVELQAQFEVVVCYDAQAAINAFHSNPDIVGAVVDVMMDPPIGFSHETHEGQTTGVWIVDQVSETIIANRVVVLFFTNRMLAYVQDEIAFMELDEQLCEVRSKRSIEAKDLPHTMTKLIQRR